MDIKNHNTDRKRPAAMRKWLKTAGFTAAFLGIVWMAFQYFGFVSEMIYEESVSHLSEVFHQSDNMLRELTNKKLTYLHMWGENLQNISGESEIREYIEKAQKDAGFLEFYFLSDDGNYKMLTGETGYLGLQENSEEEIRQGKDVITKTAAPGKAQMIVFATPKAHGSYQGFEYDAIAIAYENADIVRILDISAFNGNARSYVVHPDGRVVVDHSFASWGKVYNFFGVLREHSDISEKEMDELSEKFKEGHADAMMVKLDGRNYYLVYEKSDIQDWMFLGIVRADIVNAGMNRLQLSTVLLIGAVMLCIVTFLISLIIQKNRIRLKKKDTEILYRDELFQKLSTNVNDVFLMLDAKTYQADYVSPNVERLLGITVEQIRKDICVLGKLNPGNSEAPEKNYLEGIQVHEQKEWDFEYVHQKTGELRWFHSIAMGSEVNGKKKYILVMSDRTADRKMNQALSEAVRTAETANRAKSTFLSNMSHDIRTPMNAVIGFTTLAISNIDDKKRVGDYLDKILSSGKHLLALINDILDMSQIESGKIHLEETEVSLLKVFHDLETIISGQIQAKQLKFYMDTADVTNEDVYCDKTRLNQVLLNLLSNAVKFTPAGGTVSVCLKQYPGTVRDSGQYEIRVRDNGIGMSPEFVQKIFSPFERERTSTVSRIQGTGLGMAITRNIVNMMGGTIEVQTEQGKGTEFTVRLPLRIPCEHHRTEKTAEPGELKILPAAGPDFRGRCLLLVEDNELNREIAVEILSAYGFLVDTAENGAVAVEKVRNSTPGRYDLVLMDVQMPVMNGYEATKQIRTLDDPALSGITILAMTANVFEEDRKKALECGMNGFLSKPIVIEELIRTLQNSLADR